MSGIRASGFVLVRSGPDRLFYLLLKNPRYGWGLPKGHAGEGEDLTAAARRETEEETGISGDALRIYPRFSREIRYLVEQGPKRVTYLLARTEREKIAKEMGHLESNVLNVNPRDSSGELSGYSFHMADAGTDSMEREKAFLFASTEGRLLFEINDALRRLYKGEYGMCESCGEPIARARLE